MFRTEPILAEPPTRGVQESRGEKGTQRDADVASPFSRVRAAVSSGDAGISAATSRTWWARRPRTNRTSEVVALDMNNPVAESVDASGGRSYNRRSYRATRSGALVSDEWDEPAEACRRAADGDRAALGELLARHRDRLRRMVRLRLDQRLRGRIDPSDVLQEAYLEAFQRFDDYARDPDMPFFLWLRFLTAQRLLILHRRHFAVGARDAAREVPLDGGAMPEASSAALAGQLVGQRTTPSQAAVREEMRRRLQDALNGLDPVDREVLALRHFEQLTNAEAARVLGLRESAASMRYARALLRLKDVLAGLPDGWGGGEP
jgi:RNA polymerase sigma-70 factor (ECF subfamily)